MDRDRELGRHRGRRVGSRRAPGQRATGTHGAATVGDYYRELTRFSLRGLADRISCPTLLLDAEGDPSSSGQTDELAAALTCPTTVHHFTEAEGAGGHCEGLGQRRLERIAFDWIESVVAVRPVGAGRV